MLKFRLRGRLTGPAVFLAVVIAGSLLVLRSAMPRSKLIAAPPPSGGIHSSSESAPTVSDTPSAEFIAAALRSQESAVIEVKYSKSTYGLSDEPAIHWLKTHYIRTPEVLWATQTWMVSSREVQETSYDFATGENRRLTTRQDGTHVGRVETEISDPFTNLDLLDPVRYPLYWDEAGFRPLSGWVLRGCVLPEQEDIDGFNCWRVDVAEPMRGIQRYSIWVDPNIGFCPRRVEMATGERSVPTAAKFQDYRELAGGVWFPMKQVNEGDAGGGKRYTSILTVSEANAGKTFPKDSLLVKFPSGTELYVGRTATTPTIVP